MQNPPEHAERLIAGVEPPSVHHDTPRGGGVPRAWVLATMPMLSLQGCNAAPSQNILGSFFPAWLLCVVVGCFAALACRLLLGVAGLDKAILAPPAAYLAVALAVTLFVWLAQFGQ